MRDEKHFETEKLVPANKEMKIIETSFGSFHSCLNCYSASDIILLWLSPFLIPMYQRYNRWLSYKV